MGKSKGYQVAAQFYALGLMAAAFSMIAGCDDSLGVREEALITPRPSEFNPLVTTTAVGTIPGDSNVSADGIFSYSMPIDVPPGRAGMQPALTVAYSSTETETALGVGFTISGTSAISRCPRSIAEDGERRGVELSTDDRLCLDGQRLVAVSGTYGTASAVYRTENDELAQVESYGDAALGGFRVRLPDGRERYYGNSLEASVLVPGAEGSGVVVETWLLAREVDAAGNTIDYTYTHEVMDAVDFGLSPVAHAPPARDDVRLARIDYTGSLAGGTFRRGSRSIRFQYSERIRTSPVGSCDDFPSDPGVSTSALCGAPPAQWGFARGSASFRSSRRPLETVETYVGDTRVAQYRFRGSDAPSSHLYRLDEVQHCVVAPAASPSDADPTDPTLVCMPPTRFSWRDREVVARINSRDGETDPRFGLPTFQRYDVPWDRAALPNSARCGNDARTGSPIWCTAPNPVVLMDVNGDGADDIAYRGNGTLAGTALGDLVVRLGQPVGRATASWPVGYAPYGQTIRPAIRSEVPDIGAAAIPSVALSTESATSVDWNADGFDDLLFPYTMVVSGQQVLRILVLQSEVPTPSEQVRFVLRDTGFSEPYEETSVNGFPFVEEGVARWTTADMDGDGRQDIAACVIDSGCVGGTPFGYVPDAGFRACEAHWAVSLRGESGYGPLHHSAVETECAFEFGEAFVQHFDFETTADLNPFGGRVASGDFDGDGRQELIIATPYFTRVLDRPTRRVLRWNGSTLVATTPEHLPKFGTLTVADVNGDGLHDVASTVLGTEDGDFDGDPERPLSALFLSTGEDFEVANFEIPMPDRRRTRLRASSIEGRMIRTVLPLLAFDMNRDGRGDFVVPTLDADRTVVQAVPSSPLEPRWTWGNEGVWVAEVVGGDNFFAYPTNAEFGRTEYIESTGSYFSNPTIISHDHVVLDADGDGALDLLDMERNFPVAPITSSTLHIFHNVRAEAPLVEEIVDGMGVRTQVDYRNLSDPAVYTPSHDCVYPQRCVTDAREVVYEVRHDDGAGGFRTTRYAYADGRTNLTGRGWLGFGRVHRTDLSSGTVSVSYFDNGSASAVVDGMRVRYPLAHRPTHTVTYTADPSIHDSVALQGSEVYYGYDVLTPGPGRYRVRSSSVLERVYESLSAPTNASVPFAGATLVSETSSASSSFDAHGFPRYTTTSTMEGMVHTETLWEHDETRWRLGFPLRRTTTSSTVGLDDCDRGVVEEFLNDLPRARVRGVTRNPDDPATRQAVVFAYDAFGNVTETQTTALDEEGASETRIETINWDTDGYFPIEVINALSHVSTVAFEPRYGHLRALVDPNWIEGRNYYDGFGRARRGESDLGVVSEQTYLPEISGRFRVEMGANTGETGVVETDRLGRTVRTETRHASRTVEVLASYDARGRLRSVTEPRDVGTIGSGHATSYYYDGLDRLRLVTTSEGESTTYEYGISQVSRRNSLGHEWVTTQNGMGHVIFANEPNDAGTGLGGVTQYERCMGGEPVRVTDPAGNVTHIAYDRLGRRAKLDDPDTGGQTFTYDGWDELIRTKDNAGRATSFVRDALSRLVERVDESDGLVARWEYDTAALDDRLALGLLASSTSGDGVTDRVFYDEFGRPSSVIRSIPSVDETLQTDLKYDDFSRVVFTRYPGLTGDGVTVEYDFDDGSGEMVAVRAGIGSASDTVWSMVTQDAHGLPTSELIGTATRSSDYTPSGRIAAIRTSTAEHALQDLEYQYDPRGLLLKRRDYLSGRGEGFSHDALGRLTDVADEEGLSESYEYDALGNLLGTHDATLTYPAGIAVPRPHGVVEFEGAGGEDWTAQYDNAGNITDLGPLHLTWNQRNLPRTASRDGLLASFEYDADGGRALKVAGSETTVYAGAYEATRSGMAIIERTVIATPAGPVAQIEVASEGGSRKERTRWLFVERQGSVETSWVESDQPEHFRYDGFGGVLDTSDEVSGAGPSDNVTHGYTGHEHDDELGLINMGGRIYHPRLRRFLSADPLTSGSGQGLNRYSYVRNNPMNLVDPTGFSDEDVRRANDAAMEAAFAELGGQQCIGAAECGALDELAGSVPPASDSGDAGDSGAGAGDSASSERTSSALVGDASGLRLAANVAAATLGFGAGFFGNIGLAGFAGAAAGLAGPQAVPFLTGAAVVGIVIGGVYAYQHREELWESISRPFATIRAGEGTPMDYAQAGFTVGTVASIPVAGAAFTGARAAGAAVNEFVLPTGATMATAVAESAAAGVTSAGGVAAAEAASAAPALSADADLLATFGARVPTQSGGYFNVVTHANASAAYVIRSGEWLAVSHRTLARFILGTSGYSGQPVRLVACSAGAASRGLAQNLANSLGVDVLAPTEAAFVDSNGSFWTTGVWRLFTPGP